MFGSLAFLAFFLDWRVLVTASAVTAADHVLRGAAWPQSIYGTGAASAWRWAEHAAWVAFEDVFLVYACVRGGREMRAQCGREADLATAHRRARDDAALVARSEQQYRFLADAVPQMVWTARPDGTTDYFNSQWVEYTGQTVEQTRD